MDLRAELVKRLETALVEFGRSDAARVEGAAADLSGVQAQLEQPRNREHGDYSSNVAMQLARLLKRNPMQVAEQFIALIPRQGLISEIIVARPGFINFRLDSGASAEILKRIAVQGDEYGRTQTGKGVKALIEFVSANPTGPLHIGHARNAVVGDALGRLLDAAGYEVAREYYFNDAGVQMEMLGNTLRLRVDEQLGRPVEFPGPKKDPVTGEEHAQYYKGDYMIDIAKLFVKELGVEEASRERPPRFYTDFAVREILKTIDADLREMGIAFDSWFSETTLHENGEVEETLNELRRLGKVYKQDGAEWLRTTDFGDEKDRVVVKSDGHYTYITPDIAYHRYKFRRGFQKLINILGADHHGYIPRLEAGVATLGHDKDSLRCVITQMVSLVKDGETIKMSTRSGKFLTLREAIEELGQNVIRFFFAMRSPDTHMAFDWALAKDTSMDNPVYYVQYAHARCRSLFRKAEESGCPYAGIEGADLSLLTQTDEQALLQMLGRLPDIVDAAARDLAPQYMTQYVRDLAQIFHSWFTSGTNEPSLRCVLPDQPALTQARLALIDGLRTVLANALRILGITPMEKM
jgi:arginyl-tRNA synthetase